MDSFSLTKFIMSFFQWLPWVKTIRHLVGIGIIIGIVLFTYQKFFKKNNVQTTTFSGNVEEVNIIQKPSRFFIPFIEGSVGQGSDGLDTSIRGGARFEF